MSLLKISLSISLKYLPSSPPQQTRTTVNFLKTRLFNLNVCKIHTDSNSIYDRNDIQKYLKFLESKHSTSGIASSKKIKDTLNLLNMKKNVEADLKCLQEMSSDGNKELEELIEKDRGMLLSDIDRLKNEIVNSIIPVDEDNNRNVELQIVPNIGGEEAKLFSQELFNMYHNYVNYKNWNFTSNPECGYIYISGDNVYGQLRYETGVHRVQRVPETENLGRTHTSTCTVLVLPQPRPGEVVFNKKDIIIETKRSSGPGGQNVNKTESCVRVTHIPTGITIENQTSRFQYENKKLALERLEGKIFNLKQEELKNKYQQLKKQHVATNIYSDKIRTYNFNQNRVTDHRIQFTINNLKGFLSGTKELDRMVKTVREYFIQEELKLFIQDVLKSEEYKECGLILEDLNMSKRFIKEVRTTWIM